MIRARNLSKVFRIPHAKKQTLFHNLRSLVNGGYEYEEFYALRDITFSVGDGEFVGVMGKNGSGKTTLLKLLSEIYLPSSGDMQIRGDVYPLLELGIGFQPDFTVRDNLYIYGSFLGFSRRAMKSKLGEILDFAELQRFVDAKLDTLSSGMKARLAFAIAMQAQASIYLVDEVLAVGDHWFREKCRQEFRRLKSERRTVLLVSHAEEDVLELCDRVIVLWDGSIANEGRPQQMIEYYHSLST